MSDETCLPFPSTESKRATTEDVLSIKPAAQVRSDEADKVGAEIESIKSCCDSYFAQFTSDHHCPRCRECLIPLNGQVGTFVPGPEFGEGFCSSCNWPCRSHHNPKRGGHDIFASPLPIILAYHPTQVVQAPAEPPKESDECENK